MRVSMQYHVIIYGHREFLLIKQQAPTVEERILLSKINDRRLFMLNRPLSIPLKLQMCFW